MYIIPSASCIQCCFEVNENISTFLPSGEVEVFFGITQDLKMKYHELEYYLCDEEKFKAAKLHFSEDRGTYIACHGLLRLILSKKLRIYPSEIIINKDKNNKPGLKGNPFFFNITHVRDAFAFVISKHFYAGIDMENSDQQIDFFPILNNIFSNEERKFILGSHTDSLKRFILLWTRKESLLKAFGTGITPNLKHFEVLNQKNLISRDLIISFTDNFLNNEHFIYSTEYLNYILSIAIPKKTNIHVKKIDYENLISILNNFNQRT
jgi:4'-phosphopantetheinyl transferase